MATGAYYGNPNIQRQGEKARQIAQQRNVSDIADPRTYGFMQGLFGTAPDQLGYSVFDDPATKQAAQQAAEVGFVGGGLLSSLPIVGPALRGYGRLAANESAIAPVLGYHRTTTPFEGKFQNLKNPMGVSFAGNRGFYFSPEINDPTTDIFGKHIIAANVAVKNPAPIYQVNFGMTDGFQTPRSIIQVDKNWLKQNPEAAREGGLVIANSIDDVVAGKTLNRQGSFAEYEKQINDAAKNKKLYVLIDPEKLYDKQVSLLESKGYDGFNYVRPESATSSMPSQIVAFKPEQINRVASGKEGDILKQLGSTTYSDPFVDTIDPSIR
jgi:hypothetical protein